MRLFALAALTAPLISSAVVPVAPRKLPATMVLCRVAATTHQTPPPEPFARLPVNVELMIGTLVEVRLTSPPPEPLVVLLATVVLRMTVTQFDSATPPALEVALLPEMLQPMIVALPVR